MRWSWLVLPCLLACDPVADDVTTPTLPPVCGDGLVDDGEACDGADLAGLTCRDIGAWVGGALACDAACQLDETACATASGWIADARATPDATRLGLPIAEAVVTQVRPALGDDAAVFFVQAEAAGPALRVASRSLSPAPTAGDTVSFVIAEMATTATGDRLAQLVDAWVVDASGRDVADLASDASDLPLLALPDHESALVTWTTTLAEPFADAGADHVAAPLTEGVRLRAPAELVDVLDVAPGCAITARGTVERDEGGFRVGVVAEDEIIVGTCPAPGVLAARSTSDATIEVLFDRRLDPGSIDPGDFTFDTPLVATSAALAGPRTVTLGTTAQGALVHTLTVADLVDTLGSAVDPARDTVEVFRPDLEAQLYISEVDTITVGSERLAATAQFVEVWNNQPTAVDFEAEGWFLVLLNGMLPGDTVYRTVQLTGTLEPDGRWLVGGPDLVDADVNVQTAFFQSSLAGVILARCDDCPSASAIPIGWDVGTGATFLTHQGLEVTKTDALAYGSSEDPDLEAKLGVTSYETEGAFIDALSVSIQRVSHDGWEVGAPTPGTP